MDNLDSDGELVPGRVYYEVDVAPMTHEHVISESEVFGLLERLDEAVYEDVGEVADNDYYGVSAEARVTYAAYYLILLVVLGSMSYEVHEMLGAARR